MWDVVNRTSFAVIVYPLNESFGFLFLDDAIIHSEKIWRCCQLVNHGSGSSIAYSVVGRKGRVGILPRELEAINSTWSYYNFGGHILV